MKKFMLTLLLLINASSIYALTIGFSGTVTSVTDPEEFIDGRINAGDTFTGSVIYDLSSYSLIESEYNAHYIFNTAPNGITVYINGLMFTTNPSGGELRISVINDRPTGTPDVLSYISTASNIFMDEEMFLSSISWGLYDSTGTALSSLALPAGPPVLDDFSVRNLNISSYKDGTVGIPFTISGQVSFTENISPAIPEPMTFILCFIGFGVLGRYARFRK